MKYYFAPLEGITGYIFRNAYETYFNRQVDAYFTPFIAPSINRCINPKEKRDILPEHNQNIKTIPQILTNQAEVFIKTARELQEFGYEEVNLNLGCPSGTVVSKHRGAGFLEDPEALDRFFEVVFEGCNSKISIKTRIGMDDPEEFYDLLTVYNRYPFSEVIIHPRVREDYYKNKPNVEMFGEAIKNSPHSLCYNGDIFTVSDYKNITELFPTLDKVMLGRGLLRNPALVRQIKGGAPLQKEECRAFHDRLVADYKEVMSGDKNVLFKMKELWSYLAYSFSNPEKYIKKIRKADRMCDYLAVVDGLFAEQELVRE